MAKILISSTSEDLREHRQRLMETLRRMEQDGIGMEYFGAEPHTPVDVCRRKVEEADLVILVLAHRYGWIPTQAEGGDGVSSITRLEFDHARNPPAGTAPKPVLAFLVHENAAWTERTEQDRLLHAQSPDEAIKIYEAVKALHAFKSEVNRLVRDTFSTPADLADKAGSAVAKWLMQQRSVVQHNAVALRELQELIEKVAVHLQEGAYELALTYLENAAKTADPSNLAAIADKRLDIARANLSLYDDRLLDAAADVRDKQGKQQALAALMLGKAKSQRARGAWKDGARAEAWALAQEARSYLEAAARADQLNPDTFGTLGGLLKRMAAWAPQLHPEQVTALEDAMLAAYRSGWQHVPDAYPLLNYIEQRAVLAYQRDPGAPARDLIGADEAELRQALRQALKLREGQLGKSQDRPWAAFDLARARHYLRPNVPGFLEDLGSALEEARSVARYPADRFMVQTTSHSLRSLEEAKVRLDGLEEGIELLERAVEHDDWFLGRPKRPTQYLEQELLQLQAAMSEFADQQLRLSARQTDQVSRFIATSELRWSREDEERFQAEIVQWKRDLEPRELKIARALWKVFGSKALDALTGGIPVDWDEALGLLTSNKRDFASKSR